MLTAAAALGHAPDAVLEGWIDPAVDVLALSLLR
jgi:hypothetical protein